MANDSFGLWWDSPSSWSEWPITQVFRLTLNPSQPPRTVSPRSLPDETRTTNSPPIPADSFKWGKPMSTVIQVRDENRVHQERVINRLFGFTAGVMLMSVFFMAILSHVLEEDDNGIRLGSERRHPDSE